MSIISQKKCHQVTPHIGEVYLMKFKGEGSAQNGWRPGLVIQNNIGNQHSPNVIAIPLTTSIKKSKQPTHVFLPSKHTGLKKDSMVLCESPESIPKYYVGSYITTIPDAYLGKCALALIASMPMITYLNMNQLLAIWNETSTKYAV